MKRECCTQDCNQGRSCPQRIPTVSPVGSRIGDWIEAHAWLLAVFVGLLVVIANLNNF
jgi:hypothetical protein